MASERSSGLHITEVLCSNLMKGRVEYNNKKQMREPCHPESSRREGGFVPCRPWLFNCQPVGHMACKELVTSGLLFGHYSSPSCWTLQVLPSFPPPAMLPAFASATRAVKQCGQLRVSLGLWRSGVGEWESKTCSGVGITPMWCSRGQGLCLHDAEVIMYPTSSQHSVGCGEKSP